MHTQQKFLPYNRQKIDQTDLDAVTNALKGDIITRGEHVEAFEKAFAEYCGAQYAVAFNSGTSALLSACYAAGVSKGDRVLSTPNTFVSTVGSAVHCGATPIFVDIDLKTGNLDLEQVVDNINQPLSRGRNVVMPVHFAGVPVDMQTLDRSITDPETIVIEDAAHALGSTYTTGQKVGSCAYSQMTIFSFHPVKNITTGEGGMVTTNDPNLYSKLQLCRNNGMQRGFPDPWYYEVQALTSNQNMTEFQAALGLSQLKRLDSFIEKRRALMAKYRELLPDKMLPGADDSRTAFHLAVALLDFTTKSRTQVMEELASQGIGTQYHYIPVYRHPAFQRICGKISDYFPNMEEYYSRALSLPLFVDMEEEDVARVAKALTSILN